MQKYQWIIISVLIGYIVSFTSCDETQQMTKLGISPEETPVEPANVLIYTGSTWWITRSVAIAEAETTKSLLQSAGIQTEITENENYVKQWMLQTTADGSVNVLILYGIIPNTIYPAGNAMPDGSVAENWIETPDGNTILNHGHYFGWGSTDDPAKAGVPSDALTAQMMSGIDVGTNKSGTLRNLMDDPNISFTDSRVPMFVTTDGSALIPGLVSFESDRAFPLNQLRGKWFAEKIFASNTGDPWSTLADPIILRDEDRGRLAIVHQTFSEDNPIGKVAAAIIINYLLNPNVKSVFPYVVFPDANLAKKVREALDRPEGAAIPKAQLATLRVLKASSPFNAALEEKIRDLAGLEYATELKELFLYYNQINDISPLAELTQLTLLGLDDNQISDITALTGLTQLTTLYLVNNQINDISPLAELTQLTLLGLHNNQISDITALTGLTQLTWLQLGNNQISDITALTGLTQLIGLGLENNQIDDISPLTGLTQLGGLGLENNQISNVTALAGLINLERLYLEHNQIRDITALTGLTQLTRLDLRSNQISNVTALAGLINLERLYLEQNLIANKAPLRTLLERNPNLQIDIDVND